MNLKTLRDNIIYSSSTFSRNKGEELFNKGLVNSVKGKRIGEGYHIYGSITNTVGAAILNSHLNIDVKTSKLISCSCSCLDYEENSKYNSRYLCEHMVGTVLKFYSLALKKSGGSDKKEKLIKKKEAFFNNFKDESKIKLSLIPKLKYININDDGYYHCQLKVTDGINTALINSIYDFIREKEEGRGYSFNSKFIYSENNHYFSNNDERVFDFFKEYIDINKLITNDINALIKGKDIRILKSSIRRFLELFRGKKVELSYEHINGVIEILEEKVPLDLYGEFNNGEIIISHRKAKAINLNLSKDTILYDGKIYLLTKEQSKIYVELFNILGSNNKLILKKDNFIDAFKVISRLSNKITFSNSMRNFILEESKTKFNFNRKGREIFCTYDISALGENIDFKEFKNDVFKGSLKAKKIDMFLEKLKFVKKDDVFSFIGEDEDVYALLKDGLTSLKEFGEISYSNEFNEIKLFGKNHIYSSIYEDRGHLSLEYSIGNISENDIGNAIEALKRGESFYRTSKNSYLDLQDEEVIGFLNLVDLLHDGDNISKVVEIPENKSLYIEGKISKNNLDFIDGREKLLLLNKNIVNEKKEQPKKLNGKLRNYQLVGYNWLVELSNLGLGGILADDMGLGKTIQSISFLLEKEYKKALIVTPTTLIYNWEEEIKTFAPSLKVGIIHGSKDKRHKIFENLSDYNVILTTYGTIKNDIELYKEIYFDAMIIDEGQNIKNHKSQSAKYIKSINADFKVALTGTPIENNLMELWSIFDFIMPGYLSTEEKFKDRFINNKDNMEDLKLLISPFILRRMKKDVLKELPEKIDKKFIVEMTPSQSRVYKSYVKEVKEKIKLAKNNNITLFSYITRLRQLCLDPSLVIDDYEGGSGKIKALMDILKTNKELGIKTLVFSQFTSLLTELSKKLEEEEMNVFYLDGGTPAKERIKLVNDFNATELSTVFLISLKAGGTGLNLTSASEVIHLDPWWNPAIEDQATDRAYRIGQKNRVEVIKLISRGSIEEKIILLQEEKRALISNIINDDYVAENNLNKISSSELLELLD
ncbi:DEAD/DEAH box helicase [Clostridium massiliamazoniense]|uniref:DEAD/DEAH box helicase n=1 Tax=Clostridium massiliamazoniense TaxID=1347366 RepID=UPI0006D7E9DD|nr:SNF2-related protein [Clostridium massiliamazoniense]